MGETSIWTMDQMAYESQRDVFGRVLIELGKKNEKIVAVSPDVVLSTRLKEFAEAFPNRFYDTGIAEQATMGVVAGMATCGLIPFFVTFACFATMRDLEQVRTDLCYPKLNAKIIGSHAGLSTGSMGTTHHATEDIAIMRSLANMTVIVPSDPFQLYHAMHAVVDHDGPCYIRLIRGDGSPVLLYESIEKCSFEIGKGNEIKPGNDFTIIACGNPMVQNSFLAAQALDKEGISVRVIDMSTVKPIDKHLVLKAATETKGIMTVEDHTIIGGLGGAVAELLSEERPTPMKRIGLPDIFSTIGPPEELWNRYEMDADSLANRAKDFFLGLI